jgi:hypothetical protein
MEIEQGRGSAIPIAGCITKLDRRAGRRSLMIKERCTEQSERKAGHQTVSAVA